MDNSALQEIRQLSVAERIHLIGDIWDTIDEDPRSLTLSSDEKRELDRRLDLPRPNSDGATWPEVKKRIQG